MDTQKELEALDKMVTAAKKKDARELAEATKCNQSFPFKKAAGDLLFSVFADLLIWWMLVVVKIKLLQWSIRR